MKSVFALKVEKKNKVQVVEEERALKKAGRVIILWRKQAYVPPLPGNTEYFQPAGFGLDYPG